MLKATNRLRQRRDIDRVYKQGAYGAGEGYLSAKVAPGRAPQSRAVVVVSKKVDKRAVVRNSIRRRTAAALAEIWATVPQSYDIVISIHRDLSSLEASRITELVTTALRRARLLPH